MSLCGFHGCVVSAVGVLWGCRLCRMDCAGYVDVWFVRVEFMGVWVVYVGLRCLCGFVCVDLYSWSCAGCVDCKSYGGCAGCVDENLRIM